MKAVFAALAAAAIAGPVMAAIAPFDSVSRKSDSILLPGPLKSCQALTEKTAQTGEGPLFKRLDQLPEPLLEHAVVRSVKGCIVREVVYQGRTVWVQPSVPTVQPVAPISR